MKDTENTAKTEEYSLVAYQSRDGQHIKLSLDVVKKFLISGRPEFVTSQEIVLYMAMCKARGLNPFKRECYLIKYTQDDPAAMVVSIDYYRSRAKAQPDCEGWTTGVVVRTAKGENELREGALVFEGEKLLGGWFRAKPKGWEIEKLWTVGLDRYIKKTREGKPTRFWQVDSQAEQITKVAESQGLRRVWPDEFAKLYIKEEIVEGVPLPEPLKEEDAMPRAVNEQDSPSPNDAGAQPAPPDDVPHFKLTPSGPVEGKP